MRRTLLAITAVLLATIGTTLLYVYVSTADNRAKAQIVQVPVLVATDDLHVNTPASALRPTKKMVATFDETPSAIGNLNDVQGMVLIMEVLKGQQLTKRMFGKATAGAGGLTTGNQAVSVTFGDAARVASLTKAGSLVDIFKLAGGNATSVMTDAKVLSVQGQIVTFDLTPERAKALLNTIAGGGQLMLAYNSQSPTGQ